MYKIWFTIQSQVRRLHTRTYSCYFKGRSLHIQGARSLFCWADNILGLKWASIFFTRLYMRMCINHGFAKPLPEIVSFFCFAVEDRIYFLPKTHARIFRNKSTPWIYNNWPYICLSALLILYIMALLGIYEYSEVVESRVRVGKDEPLDVLGCCPRKT